jgi:hypothetical protein
MNRITVIALLAATSLLTACGDFGAEPIITGNDRVVVSGGPGGLLGGSVGTLPQQGGSVQQQPIDAAPAPTYESQTMTGTFQDTNGQLPMPSETPAQTPAATPAASEPQASAGGCDYTALKGKPLSDDTMTKLVQSGKVVRELKPGQAITMEHLANRVNIIVDPATKNVVDVTCG